MTIDRRERSRRIDRLVSRAESTIADRLASREELADALLDAGFPAWPRMIDWADAHQHAEVARGIRPGAAAGAAIAIIAIVGEMSPDDRLDAARRMLAIGGSP